VARERKQFTPADGQGHVIEHAPTAEGLANAIDDQQRPRFGLNGRRAHGVGVTRVKEVTAAGMRLSRTAAAYSADHFVVSRGKSHEDNPHSCM
jgi:hypothetical protein